MIQKAARIMLEAKRVCVFTGAGISVESGIPPFRGKGGLWNQYNPEFIEIGYFHRHPQQSWQLIKEIFYDFFGQAVPNDAHRAIASLEKQGIVKSVITQNIDNLHQKAGNDPDFVYELHGNMEWMVCLECGKRYPVDSLIEEIKSEDYVPDCENCGGILKPDVIFFGEALPQKTLMDATREAQECDLFIVIGSSLVVYPAAYMPVYAKRGRAKLVIINIGPTEQDDLADVIIDHSAGETMTKIMQKLKAVV